MKAEVVNQLIELNKRFYAQFAGAFSASRSSRQDSLNTVVMHIGGAAKVLDLGCGNGRLARRLEREERPIAYLGLDWAEMVRLAISHCEQLCHVAAEFRLAELTRPGWGRELPGQPFETAVALAVLHHIPSFELRCDVLREVSRVLAPGSQLLMTNWQFTHNARLRNKIVDWQIVGVDSHELEAGDALLDWKRDGLGFRYCHLLTEDEVQLLAAQSGFEVREQFYSDGGLNLYSILKRKT
ncbi:MAG: class I SAM-dependent methyltransferase [Thermoflexales bacterium]|nr:class I SAM-dependent methyltransferase [Thermoflexales bacterium]